LQIEDGKLIRLQSCNLQSAIENLQSDLANM
jgi:hypothetical protein